MPLNWRIWAMSSGPKALAKPQAVSMSPSYFHRVFKAATGLTPKAYANAHRSVRVQKALPRWNTVTEAIYESGFNSNGRFYANSSKILGMKP